MSHCQACNHAGVEMWDICESCGWENDILYPIEGSTSDPQSWHSDANGMTLAQWRESGADTIPNPVVPLLHVATEMP